MSDAVREFKFVYQIMEPLKIKVKLPFEVNVDNVGVVFLAKTKMQAKERNMLIQGTIMWDS
jgi:hypothetical protein